MVTPKSIVVVSDSSDTILQRLRSLLVPEEFELGSVVPGPGFTDRLIQMRPGLVVLNVPLSGAWDYIATIISIHKISSKLPVILITSHSSEQQAVEALRAGANDYINSSVTDDDLLKSLQQSFSSPNQHAWHKNSNPEKTCELEQCLIGQSVIMQDIKRYLSGVACSDSNVLISGETGTGKDVVAQLIHRLSNRRTRRMVCMNCAAMPETLLESELFGYDKGAFTGATSCNEGKLKLAEGGSVFFDEIGDMSMMAQTKILRAIENKAVFRLGGKKEVPLDFRIIAATNQELESKISDRSFRRDLYYRLNVARIHLPPLREHKEDIPYLISHFLRELNLQFGSNVTGIQQQALDILLAYHWPGNVRELKNVLEVALINRPPITIGVRDLPQSFQENINQYDGQDQERDTVLTALLSTNWNKSRAAKKLNWSRMTLYRKIQKYHLTNT